MKSLRYTCGSGDPWTTIELVYVQGTRRRPFQFGAGMDRRRIEVSDFFIATVPVTQAMWTHVMGDATNPSFNRADQKPVEGVSWDTITKAGGFLDTINKSRIRDDFSA